MREFCRKISVAGIIIYSLVLSGVRNFQAISANGDTSSSTTELMSREDLQNQIQEKAKALQTINQQIDSARQGLKETQSKKVGLQRALGVLQNNINQLNLSIKADEITNQKLGLEISSLNYDLQDIESSIEDKRNAISQILKEFQKTEDSNGNLLAVLLKNGSLADGIFEIQTLSNLQAQLTIDIPNLQALHDEYNNKIQEAGAKQDEISFHQQDQKNKKLIIQDQQQERKALLAQTKDREAIYDRQVSDLQKMQEQISNEIESLDAILRTKIDPSLLPAPAHGVLQMPVDRGENKITQGYGATAFAQHADYVGKWHNGIDIGSPIGTPVFAADDGEVAAVRNQDAYCYHGAYGRFIVINHKNNLTTLYAHLSRQVVQKGDIVKRGDLIGYVGNTGYATGPHLHFTVYAQPTYYLGVSRSCGPMPHGGDLNPLSYL